MGFKDTKKQIIDNLMTGNYSHETRGDIPIKNLLAMGQITVQDVIALIKRSRGNEYNSSPHHLDKTITVHIIQCDGWYIKFYFDPDAMFISVHR